MPIGKYKGQPLSVIELDPNYKDWLLNQSWFRDKFENLHTLIINNFSEVSETPDHNAMQSLFLDENWVEDWILEGNTNIKIRNINSRFEQDGFDVMLYFDIFNIEKNQKNLAALLALKEKLLLALKKSDVDELENLILEQKENYLLDGYLTTIKTPFNNLKWQIKYDKDESDKEVRKATLETEINNIEYLNQWHRCSYLIELKPCIGDDYPAILRRIKANYQYQSQSMLVYQQFAASGISEENLIKLFKKENIIARRL